MEELKKELFNDVVIAYDANEFMVQMWTKYGFSVELKFDTFVRTIDHNGTGINIRYVKLPCGKRALFYACEGSMQDWSQVDDFIAKYCPSEVVRGGTINSMIYFPYMMQARRAWTIDHVDPRFEQWVTVKPNIHNNIPIKQNMKK